MGGALRFKQQPNSALPRQNGELGRFKVVQGADRGSIFVITGKSFTMGRGEDNDIVISDIKASRRHVQVLVGPTGWSIRDMGSSNGFKYNGKEVKAASLRFGDAITLGETTLEFVTAEAGTAMLSAPPKDFAKLQAEQAAFAIQQKKAQSFGKVGGMGRPQPHPRGIPNTSRKPLFIAAALLVGVVFFVLPDQQPVRVKKEEKRDLSSILPPLPPPATDPSVTRTAEQFFRTGFREYREKNYLRAKVQFDTVLQIDPGHTLARRYSDNCDLEIKNQVAALMGIAQKDVAAGKLKEAKGQYEQVLRLLFRDQNNPAFIEAREQLIKVAKAMSIDDGGGSG